jgi:uncharacterized protein (DUF58 family)
LRAKVLWGLLAAILALLALASGSTVLFTLLFALLAVPAIGYAGSAFSTRRLRGEVRRLTPFLQVGDTLEEEITVQNLHWFPKLLLETVHETPLFGTSGRVLTLWPYSSATWMVSKHCERRGLYEFGELTVTSRDPLGLFNRTLRLGERQTELIYPATVELPGFFVPSGHGWTEGMIHGRTFTPSPIAYAVRDYVRGDAVSHIHWLATAKTGKLMVKEFEREPSGPADAIWVLLDLTSRYQAGEGVQSTVEYGVTIAASIAKRFLETGRTVGIVVNGQEETRIRPGTGMAQIGRVLEALALVQPGDAGTLATAAQAVTGELTPGASVVVISSAPVTDIAVASSLLEGAGASVVPIIVEQGSFMGNPHQSGDIYLVPGTVEAAYVVHKGDEIERRLDFRMHGPGRTFGQRGAEVGA